MNNFAKAIRAALAIFFVTSVLCAAGCEKNNENKSIGETGESVKTEVGEETEFILTDEDKKTLLKIARVTLNEWVTNRKTPSFDIPGGLLESDGAAFVTLRKHGRLRGCIGHLTAREPLWMCVRDMAVAASTHDSRFKPVEPDELDEIVVEVSVLTPPRKVDNYENIVLGRDGVIVRKGFKKGVFLPQVATETGWDLDTFLSNLCSHKAFLPSDCYRDPDVVLMNFQAIVFEEEHGRRQ